MIDNEARDRLLQEVKEQLERINSQVFFILEKFPETRGNDTLLICLWLEMFKGVRTYGDLFALATENNTSFESVRRARQKIQQLGFYLPEDPVIIKRRKLERVHRIIQSQGGDISGEAR